MASPLAFSFARFLAYQAPPRGKRGDFGVKRISSYEKIFFLFSVPFHEMEMVLVRALPGRSSFGSANFSLNALRHFRNSGTRARLYAFFTKRARKDYGMG